MQTRHLTIAVAIALSAASAHAATDTGANASTDAALGAQTLDTVSVIGQGETRQVQRITTVDKQVLPPGTSGQKILDRLPGVSVQSNDAFGANEESQTISLRGFDKSRLGYTLDGIPLGDNSYGNYNGLSIARALIAENLAGAELSQGIGSLGVASTMPAGLTTGSPNDTADRPIRNGHTVPSSNALNKGQFQIPPRRTRSFCSHCGRRSRRIRAFAPAAVVRGPHAA